MLNWAGCFYQVYGDEEKPPKEGSIPITCPICGTHTDAPIVNYFVTKQNDFIKLPTYEMSLHNYLLKCTFCNGPILLIWPYGEDHRGIGQTIPRRIFPFYTEKPEIASYSKVIPSAINEDLIQAELCYYANAYLGAGLLLRRACQNICRDKNCQGKNLEKEIKDLANKGIITNEMVEQAHSIRIIANEIAHPHPNKPFIITFEDVRICREFTHQLVEIIYIYPHKRQVLERSLKRRGVKKNKK